MRAFNYTLTPTRINNAKPKSKVYKLSDAGGLFIEISLLGLKSWRYQYRLAGKRNTVTIGKGKLSDVFILIWPSRKRGWRSKFGQIGDLVSRVFTSEFQLDRHINRGEVEFRSTGLGDEGVSRIG